MFKGKTLVTTIYFLFVTIALSCFLLLLLQPPHAHVAQAATHHKAETYFQRLAQSTTTTTTEPMIVMPLATTPPPPTSKPFVYNTDQVWLEELIKAFFPENPELWITISRCETAGSPHAQINPTAYNPEGASGMFQIMMPLHSDMVLQGEDIFDPVVNVRIAHSLSNGGKDTSPWIASKGCWN